MERLKPLDQKLKYQVDKLLKIAAIGGNALGNISFIYFFCPEMMKNIKMGISLILHERENPLIQSLILFLLLYI